MPVSRLPTAASALALGVGVDLTLAGSHRLKPILAAFIEMVIVIGAVRLAREAIEALPERPPSGIVLDKVSAAIATAPGMDEVRDLDNWSITRSLSVLSRHVRVDYGRHVCSDEVFNRIKQKSGRCTDGQHSRRAVNASRPI